MPYLESDFSVALIARPARYNESSFSQEIQAVPEAVPIAPVSFTFIPGNLLIGVAEMVYPDGRTFTVILRVEQHTLTQEAEITLSLASPGSWPERSLYFDPGRNILAIRLGVSTGEAMVAPALLSIRVQDLGIDSDPPVVHLADGSSWTEVPASVESGLLTFELPQDRVAAIQTNLFPESKAGRRMGRSFPVWTKIRRDRGSIGRQFLNAPGLELDEAKRTLDQMLASLFLDTLDPSQVFQVDAAILPKDAALNLPYRIYAGEIPLPIIARLQEFYKTEGPAGYVEPASRSVYLRNAPGKIAFTQNGKIHWLERTVHHVWNDFDEFGLLLGLPRIPGEDNERYRTRLRTFGWVLPGSSKTRLLTDWARRLGLLTELVWNDDRNPLEIEGATPHACFVDGILYPATATETGARLDPPDDAKGESHQVTALLAIQSAPLFEREKDPWLAGRLYDAWGEGTSAYRSLISDIGRSAPVLWREIRVGEALWEAGRSVGGGFGFLPAHMDPIIKPREEGR